MIIIALITITTLILGFLVINSVRNDYCGNQAFSISMLILFLIFTIPMSVLMKVGTKETVLPVNEYIYAKYNSNGKSCIDIEYDGEVYTTSVGTEYIDDDCTVYLIQDINSYGMILNNEDSEYTLYIEKNN